ncbi:MAG: hypothetical protein PF904_21040 [Kiritimatiellae bacterium]|jgi:hypothetical protein|nr:hypothetical protein [Kiritimatiellia bacterium]
MKECRKEYKWVRLITGGVVPVVLALVVLAVVSFSNEGWEPAGRLAGICKELAQGTTEGRQALAGSCWFGPMATLFYLPVAWAFPAKFAGGIAFFLAFFLMLWSVREALKSSVHAFTHIIAAQVGISVLALTVIPVGMLSVNTVLPVAFFTIAFGSLLDWSAQMRLRDIVMTGVGVAMISISGFHFFALALWLALAIPFIWFWHRQGERFARTTSSALIGWLPLIYSFGTWILLNWLIMGDPVFFLRSLMAYSRESGYMLLITVLIPGVLIIGYLKLGILFFRNRVETVASVFGNRVFSLLIVIASVGYICSLSLVGLKWCASELLLSVLMIVLIFCVRFFDNRVLVVGSSALFVACSIWIGSISEPYSSDVLCAKERVALRNDVEDYVKEHTEYGRIFVPGYIGLSLLQDYTGDMMAPNLHFHVNTLRQDYFGQDLYVLVAKPEGVTAMEYVFAAYPGIYKYGCERLLFAKSFGDWHLFQVVSAPTWRELNAAKKQ